MWNNKGLQEKEGGNEAKHFPFTVCGEAEMSVNN